MSEEDDYLEDDEWEPTEEQKQYYEHLQKLHDRFPTFSLLARAMMRHERYEKLRKLECPAPILNKADEMRRETMDELCAAFPRSDDIWKFRIEHVLAVLKEELLHPHDSSKTDA